MDHQKKLDFVLKMTKHGLDSVQHLDAGGTVLSGPGGVSNPAQTVNNNGLTGTISNALGTNDQYQAGSAPIQAGTNAAQLNGAYSGVQGAINTQAGITGTLNNGLNQGANTQSNLSNVLTNQINGTGPNPAQAALNQNTGQNIAQQAALAAGTRGAGANAGLIARENAQQGAATQQSSVGQGATLQAQQQIAAENNLQNLAANQVAQGQGATTALNQTQQNEQNILQNANTSENNANVAMQGNINNVNAGVAANNQTEANKTVGGISGLASNIPVVGSLFSSQAKGGLVKAPKKMADGGSVGPQSGAGQWLNSEASPGPVIAAPASPQASSQSSGGSALASAAPAIIAALAAKGGKVLAENKSEKAVKKDNSYANDKIPTMLSEGEIVIPRAITMHPMAPEKAAEFVRRALAKKKFA